MAVPCSGLPAVTLGEPHVRSRLRCPAKLQISLGVPARLQQVRTDARQGEGLAPPQEMREPWPRSVALTLQTRNPGIKQSISSGCRRTEPVSSPQGRGLALCHVVPVLTPAPGQPSHLLCRPWGRARSVDSRRDSTVRSLAAGPLWEVGLLKTVRVSGNRQISGALPFPPGLRDKLLEG